VRPPDDRRQRLADGWRRAPPPSSAARWSRTTSCSTSWPPSARSPAFSKARFDEEFLELPREVLATSLRDHQSAFTVERDGTDGAAAVLPLFLTVMDRPDDPAGRVRAGNEWVVAARLADARFFYREDRRVAARRSRRAAGQPHLPREASAATPPRPSASKRSPALCDALGWDGRRAPAAQAARLLKADLTTEMVKEFTSLQGVMGGIYAREEGHPEAVWQAIYDQYLPASTDDPSRAAGPAGRRPRRPPRHPGRHLRARPGADRQPRTRSACAAPRRGWCGSLLEAELSFAGPAGRQGRRASTATAAQGADERWSPTCWPFLDDRVRHLLASRGSPTTRSRRRWRSTRGAVRRLPDLARRVAALHEARRGPDFLSVVLAAKRIANITKGQEEFPSSPALVEEAELDLHERATPELRGEIDRGGGGTRLRRGLAGVASLADTLDRFFDDVLVMAEDPACAATASRCCRRSSTRGVASGGADRDGGREGPPLAAPGAPRTGGKPFADERVACPTRGGPPAKPAG
jgi:glycyl-tRNA synthetase beta chain